MRVEADEKAEQIAGVTASLSMGGGLEVVSACVLGVKPKTQNPKP